MSQQLAYSIQDNLFLPVIKDIFKLTKNLMRSESEYLHYCFTQDTASMIKEESQIHIYAPHHLVDNLEMKRSRDLHKLGKATPKILVDSVGEFIETILKRYRRACLNDFLMTSRMTLGDLKLVHYDVIYRRVLDNLLNPVVFKTYVSEMVQHIAIFTYLCELLYIETAQGSLKFWSQVVEESPRTHYSTTLQHFKEHESERLDRARVSRTAQSRYHHPEEITKEAIARVAKKTKENDLFHRAVVRVEGGTDFVGSHSNSMTDAVPIIYEIVNGIQVPPGALAGRLFDVNKGFILRFRGQD